MPFRQKPLTLGFIAGKWRDARGTAETQEELIQRRLALRRSLEKAFKVARHSHSLMKERVQQHRIEAAFDDLVAVAQHAPRLEAIADSLAKLKILGESLLNSSEATEEIFKATLAGERESFDENLKPFVDGFVSVVQFHASTISGRYDNGAPLHFITSSTVRCGSRQKICRNRRRISAGRASFKAT
jgi:hypothetical protein